MPIQRDPIDGLPPIENCPAFKLTDLELFTKHEVAQALGTEHWQITRDSQLLWGNEIDYQPLSRSQAWMLYSVACYRRFVYFVLRQSKVRGSEILKFANYPEPHMLKLIESVGGSRQDFETRIDQIILKRRIKTIL